MKTLILNGSPKGERGNSQIFASHFAKGAGACCDIKCIVRESYQELAGALEGYDTVIFIMPLYVHAMPGIVMKLFEQMKPLSERNKTMGFIIQSGFMEPAQSRYAKQSLELLCKRLNYNYMGTVIKGGAAGVYVMPDGMNRKLFAELEELGRYYGETGCFSESIKSKFEKNYELSKGQARFNQILYKAGIGDLFWNSMLKKNNVFAQRYAKPFEISQE